MEKNEIWNWQSFMKEFKKLANNLWIIRPRVDFQIENGKFQTILDNFFWKNKNELSSFLLKNWFKLKNTYNDFDKFWDNENKSDFTAKKILVWFLFDNLPIWKIIVVEPIKILISKRADDILNDKNRELEEKKETIDFLDKNHINL